MSYQKNPPGEKTFWITGNAHSLFLVRVSTCIYFQNRCKFPSEDGIVSAFPHSDIQSELWKPNEFLIAYSPWITVQVSHFEFWQKWNPTIILSAIPWLCMHIIFIADRKILEFFVAILSTVLMLLTILQGVFKKIYLF